jgi:DUF1680 family protein
MYSGMADIAAIEKNDAYVNAITKIWEDIVYGKIYLTGGIGATGGNEGFAEPFVLPNMSAYCETCASIGNIFTNHRLFLFHGDGKYMDILEKTLYNSMLSGVSLSGDRFFYPNPLESNGQHERQAWFGCACCPSNVARFVPAIPGYIYGVTNKELYVNLYISNDADVYLGKSSVKISQKANFRGTEMLISVDPTAGKILHQTSYPGWAGTNIGSLANSLTRTMAYISVNGKPESKTVMQPSQEMARVTNTLELPMPVRKVR